MTMETPQKPKTPSPDTIKRMREKRQLTQKGLADKIGVTVTTVSRWETGLAEPNMYYSLILNKLNMGKGKE